MRGISFCSPLKKSLLAFVRLLFPMRWSRLLHPGARIHSQTANDAGVPTIRYHSGIPRFHCLCEDDRRALSKRERNDQSKLETNPDRNPSCHFLQHAPASKCQGYHNESTGYNARYHCLHPEIDIISSDSPTAKR